MTGWTWPKVRRTLAEPKLQALGPIREVLRSSGLREGSDFLIIDPPAATYRSLLLLRDAQLLVPTLLAALVRSLGELRWGLVVVCNRDLLNDGPVAFDIDGLCVTPVLDEPWVYSIARTANEELGFKAPGS
jgi:hypothetical protein